VPAEADLPDVNVWLALSVADHAHHSAARRYWYKESAGHLAFCRVTALGLLRLLTNDHVMGGAPLSTARAWEAYLAFRRLPEVVLASDPEGSEAVLAPWLTKERFPARLLTDAYLAAFAHAGGFRLVSFDEDFARFDGVEILRLSG
jgi:uncharacterized protein